MQTQHENQPNLYEAKYNFISIPRAVRLLSTYGSARNIQEGGTDGEGVVKMLRPLTPRGLKHHFARNLINAFHRDQQLSEFSEQLSKHVDTAMNSIVQPEVLIRNLMDSAESLLTSTDEDIGDDDEDPDEARTVHPRLSCSIKPDSNDIQQNEENDLDISFELDGQHYKRYKSRGVCYRNCIS
mgnify:FL=1